VPLEDSCIVGKETEDEPREDAGYVLWRIIRRFERRMKLSYGADSLHVDRLLLRILLRLLSEQE
jgi:hypothetical protein